MLKTKLRPYQIEAVEKYKRHDGFLFSAEQRCGKTLMCLATVDYRRPRYLVILCPKNAFRVWREQIAEHLEIEWPMEIEIFNLQLLGRRRKEFYKWADKLEADGDVMLICDEAHQIKRRGSKQSKALRVLARRARWRIGATGTPIGQGSQDVWAIFNFIDSSILGRFEQFADRYLTMGGFKGKKIVGYRNQAELKRIIHEHMYRITLAEARSRGGGDSMRIHRVRVPVQLEQRARAVYDSLESNMSAVVDGVRVKLKLAITLTTKLQQICGGYIKVGEHGFKEGTLKMIGSEKYAGLINVLFDRIPEKAKAVIVCKYTEEIRTIERLCPTIGKTFKTIEGGVQFDGKFDTDLVLLQVQSGMAFDLSAADHMILFSWNHSHFDHDQCLSRIKNFTKRCVSYYYLIVEDSVDEVLFETAVRKKKFATALLDHHRRRSK